MAKPKQQITPEDEITFNLLDTHTVDRLRRTGDVKLPRRTLDVPKDEKWNTKQMSSRLLQGILNGDSIPKIADRLMDIVGNNEVSAIRNARTMVTGAENVGRLDSYKDLADKGVVQRKIWIATLDDRTRESHAEIDGEEVEIDKAFSNGLMYPGDTDSSVDPSEVWNCRCSMKDHIIGFRRADGTISYVEGERDTTSHIGKIEEERARRGIEEEIPASTVIQREEKTEGDGTYGEDQLGHKYTREEYEERLEILNEYDKYHYHATTFNAIRGIKEEGLKPSIGHSGEEVYMAKTKNSALEWTSSTSTGGTVVIRVANTFLAQTDYIDYDHNIKGEGSTSVTIPLSQLEILTSDGKWIPLKDAVVSYMRGVPTIIRKPR